MKNVKKAVERISTMWTILNNENIFNERLKYLFIPEKSEDLLVVFSGFTGDTPKYNYVRSFQELQINKLYILDDFGHKGSYYLYENGSDYPQKLVCDLIRKIMNDNGIKNLITAGSSKGGSCAIYFGLELRAKIIYAAACQYYIGTYLAREKHRDIFKAMMGQEVNEGDVNKLDNILCKKIQEQPNHLKPKIHLFYSTKELTYERQMVPLIYQLNKNDYALDEYVVDFENHDDVGLYFPKYLIDNLAN